MSIKERDEHLNKIFDVETEENLPVETEEKEVITYTPLNSDLQNENLKNKKKLEEIYEEAQDVLTSAKDSATEFSTPRDIEVFAKLLDSMRDLQKTILDTNEKIYNKEEKEDNTKNVQNNFFIGSSRELADLIKKHEKEDVT